MPRLAPITILLTLLTHCTYATEAGVGVCQITLSNQHLITPSPDDDDSTDISDEDASTLFKQQVMTAAILLLSALSVIWLISTRDARRTKAD